MSGVFVSESLSHRISAILPVKNGEKYLQRLLPDVLDMLQEHDEVIIINDGSSDQSRQIIEKFSDLDARIHLLNTTGVGLVNALNLGISASINPWIARFDVDDLFPKDRLSEQRKLISNDVSVIFSDYRFVSQRGLPLGRVPSAVFPDAVRLSILSSQRTAHPVSLINRRLLLQAGGYRSLDYPAEDLALWLRLSSLGKVVSSPKILLSYRLTVGSVSMQNRKVQKDKTKEIISNFDLWKNWQEACITNFYNTVSLYASSSCASARIFLHIRDIQLAQPFTGISMRHREIYRTLGTFGYAKVFFAGIWLTSWAVIRRIYRRL